MRISDWSSDVCSSDLFGAGVADIAGIDEYGRDAGVYKGGFQRSDARHFKIVDQLAGGKHGTARAVFFGGGVHEFKLHFGGRKCHAIQFEVAGFLHLALGNGYVRADGLPDVGLHNTYSGHAVFRNAAAIRWEERGVWERD